MLLIVAGIAAAVVILAGIVLYGAHEARRQMDAEDAPLPDELL